nr:TIGR04283 family arsenosugar biosynthesis glycosyltransferase [uncultured Pontibacter sp.]
MQEEKNIAALLEFLKQHTNPETEIIVADGGSTDATRSIAERAGAKVILCSGRGRAPQLNQGAAIAEGAVLYFLHADTYPPQNFEASIKQAVRQGYSSGCFRLKFNTSHWFLNLNAWFTRFDVDALRFGDQSLFVTSEVFKQIGGFREQMLLLEDQEIVKRLRKVTTFKVLGQYVTTSCRKYKQVGVYKLQAGYFLIYALYRLGFAQQRLVRVYTWLLHV